MRFRNALWTAGVAVAVAFISGCGSTETGIPTSPFSGSTTVTLLASSTANDRLARFNATLNSLTLTSQSGATVSLLPTPLYLEFMHVNGTPELLATVSIPQGVYVSATASLGPTTFTCQTVGPNGSPATSVFGTGATVPSSDVTVSLPTPITITGTSMDLSLDMLVSKSASFPASCYVTDVEPFTLTPTLAVTPMEIAAQPTNSSNGKLYGLEGVVASSDSTGISVTSADGSNYGGTDPSDSFDPANGPTWNIIFSANTVFQGIAGASRLTAGMPVDIDATLQADGSLLASRVAVYDTQTANTSLWIGPIVAVKNNEPVVLYTMAREQTGPVLTGGSAPVDFDNSVFGISGQLTNLASLPFPAIFTSANMVPGQNAAYTFHYSIYPDDDSGPAPSSITLLPQTIDGTVSAVSTSGGFTTYTVTLAPYDLFPALAAQSGQTSPLASPGTVVIYVDGNTQLLNSMPLAVGGVFRFNGLVFDDHGTLRMDCGQITDGVAM
jgi:Domain of unknown function (DUF5666)